MGSQLSGNVLLATVSQFAKIDTLEKGLARSKYYRRYCDMHFVDQAFLEELSDCTGTSANTNILATGCVTS